MKFIKDNDFKKKTVSQNAFSTLECQFPER